MTAYARRLARTLGLIALAAAVPFMAACQEEPPFQPYEEEVVITNVYAWEGLTSLLSFTRPTHVHFGLSIPNPHDTPISIRNLKYEVRSPSGVVLHTGTVPNPQPQTLGAGEVGVAGRTIDVDAATDPMDIGSIRVTYEVRPSKDAPVWLAGNVTDVQFNALSQQVVVRGTLTNPSRTSTAEVQGVALALLVPNGNVYAYGTGRPVVREIPPGASTLFEVEIHADLPVEDGRIALPGELVVLSWASGISDGVRAPVGYGER